MRIASVLHDASPEPDGAPLFPAMALERDGALYRVSALARAFGPRYAALADDDVDFLHSALALRGALLHELDERLRAGERPSSARLLPGTFTWLPPCDTERAAIFTCAGAGASAGAASYASRDVPLDAPSFRAGSARALFGHDATVPLPAYAARARIGGALAAVLCDDLFRADAEEAEQAILGYTVLLAFTPGLAAQLGPVLVTRDEAGPVTALRTQLRVDGSTLPTEGTGAAALSPAEAIAWISHHVPLAAGDVIGAVPICGAASTSAPAPAPAPSSASDLAIEIACGARVELAIERLGRLGGRAAIGPELRAWKRPAPRP